MLLTTQSLIVILISWVGYRITSVEKKVANIERVLNIPVTVLENGKDIMLSPYTEKVVEESNLQKGGNLISSTKKLEEQSL